MCILEKTTIVLSTLSRLICPAPASVYCLLAGASFFILQFCSLRPLSFCVRRNIIQNQFISSEKLTTHIIIRKTIFMIVRRSALCASNGTVGWCSLRNFVPNANSKPNQFCDVDTGWDFSPQFNGYPTPFAFLVQRARISIAKLERYTRKETVRLH